VSLSHLEQLAASGAELPAFVQNRCFATLGWDREVRRFCRDRGMTYQGFSLLTANADVVHHPQIENLATSLGATRPQIIFAFARAIGILPITGTSSSEHMKQDLSSLNLALPAAALSAIESLAG